MGERVGEVFAAIEPYLFKFMVGALLLAAAIFGYRYFAPASATHLGGAKVVVFDVVKLANAQRRVASAFLGKDPGVAGEEGSLLLEVQGRTAAVVRQVAGPGTIVLVKQAVIHTDLPDITDDVLRGLKLPVDVPTQNVSATGLDYAPTVLGVTPAPKSYLEKRGPLNSLNSSESVLP